MMADDLKRKFKLQALPEGRGYFSEIFRSGHSVRLGDLIRPASSVIYFLLTEADKPSILKVRFDEHFHFVTGDPVELVQISPTGQVTTTMLGSPSIETSLRPFEVVPAESWHILRLPEGSSFALLCCTVSPGLESADISSHTSKELKQRFPELKDLALSSSS
jgi:predicted cupin superfamily sugar epimerase